MNDDETRKKLLHEELTALRDQFASKALQALLPAYMMQQMQMKMTMGISEPSTDGALGTTGQSSLTFGDFNHDEVATEAYLMADAMMRARDGKSNAAGLLMNVLREEDVAKHLGFNVERDVREADSCISHKWPNTAFCQRHQHAPKCVCADCVEGGTGPVCLRGA